MSNLATRYNSLQSRWQNATKKHEKTVERVGRTMTLMGSTFVVSFARGRWGNKFNIGGVPFELAGAAVCTAAALWGGDKTADLASSVADGFGAAYMAQLGQQAGVNSLLKK